MKTTEVKEVIDTLIRIDIDGETMQYILEQVGMEDQMLKQLISISNDRDINYYLELKNIEKQRLTDET
jgi:hypothetical protein